MIKKSIVVKLLQLFLISILFPVLSSAQDIPSEDWANLNKYREANSQLEPAVPGEDRVVFMGNSITEFWMRYDPEFFGSNPYINRGIAGQTTAQMLVRFRPDVIDLKPAVVIIHAGTNDIAGNTGPMTVPQIAGNIFSMAELAKAHGIDVVLASVLPATSYSWRPGIFPADKIVELNGMIEEFTMENNCIYLDYYSPMVNGEKGLKKEYGRDSVHPNPAGYRVMGQLVKKAIADALGQNPAGCFPGEYLPEYIIPLTEFGQRSEWSHDGRKVYFVDKAGGEVWCVDVETKRLTQITHAGFRPEGHGYYRVYELANGDLFFTCGPERHDLYMQILKKGSDGPPHTIHEKIDEGPAISRTDMKIVWTPDQKVIYSGKIITGTTGSSIKGKKLIINNKSVVVDDIKYNGILEPQNFRPPEEREVIWTQYGNTEAGLFTSETMGYDLETGVIINYSKSPDQYSEPEGIFPDGDHTLIESDRHSLKGIKSIDLYKLKLDGTGKHLERLTFFNDLEGFKGSNGVVSDDGSKIAFQAANANAATGVGCGIYLFDLEKWESFKSK